MYEGGGQRGSIVVPEGREGRGCRFFAAELGKAVAFFDHFHSSGSRGAVPRQPLGGAQATEVGGPFSSTTRNALSLGGFSVHSLGGGSRSVVPWQPVGGSSNAEVLGRAQQPLSCPMAPVLPTVLGTRRVQNLSAA